MSPISLATSIASSLLFFSIFSSTSTSSFSSSSSDSVLLSGKSGIAEEENTIRDLS